MKTEKKYKLTDECITISDKKLYRIESLREFSDVKKGDKGGFVENKRNLSQIDDCWIYNNAAVFDNALVYGNARIYGDAKVYENARIYGNTKVHENARIFGNALVFGNADVYGDARIFGESWVYGNARVFGKSWVYGYAGVYDESLVCDNAKVYGSAEIRCDAKISSDLDYIVFKNWWSSGRYFTWTRSNNMWKVGCFYGTGEELISRAYKDSELSGKEYERIVKYVESILKDSNKMTIVNKIKQCLIKITKKFNL